MVESDGGISVVRTLTVTTIGGKRRVSGLK